MNKLFLVVLCVFLLPLISCSNENANILNETQLIKGEESVENNDEYQYIFVDSFTVVTSYIQLEGLNESGWEISGYDESYFITNNLVVFHFSRNSQEKVIDLVNTIYDLDNQTLYIDINVESPGHFSIHSADIQMANILIEVPKAGNINKIGMLVYNVSLNEFHSVYYNCSMKTWEDYLSLPNS